MSNGEYGKLIFDVLSQDDTKYAVSDLLSGGIHSFTHRINPRRHADEGADASQTVKALHQCPRICGLFGLGSPDDDEETEVGSGKASDDLAHHCVIAS
jgi:hypothetical protein